MITKYYLIDNKTPIYFEKFDAVIKYLETMLVGMYKLNRQQFMQNYADLGYGVDEPTHKNFLDAMSEQVEIGVIRNKTRIRCNIYEATHYSKYLDEMGS